MAFKKLNRSSKLEILRSLKLRKTRFCAIVQGQEVSAKVLIVGDRPGPAAPKTSTYHHTPFYSVKHCSGWLNERLVAEGIAERDLVWLNSAAWQGNDYALDILDRVSVNSIVALGGNAARWLSRANKQFVKVDHPQFHKRFKSKLNYPLFDVLHTNCAG